MKVKIARIRKGLTQAQLCKIVKTSPKKLVEIERGNYANINISLAKRISNALDEEFENLFLSGDEDDEQIK